MLAAERERRGDSGAKTLPKLADSCENPIAICVCLAKGTKYSIIEKRGMITLDYDKTMKQSSELSQTEKDKQINCGHPGLITELAASGS